LFRKKKIKFSIYAQNLKLQIMFDDVRWWFMFSNYRCTVALYLPFWRVRNTNFTKLRLLALPYLFVRPYVPTPEPLNFHKYVRIFLGGQLCQCWVKNQRFGDLLHLHHQGECGEWPRVTETYIPVSIFVNIYIHFGTRAEIFFDTNCREKNEILFMFNTCFP
jgi:hypothetical protein